MTGLSNAHHFRKLVAGACMVLAPLALLIAMVDNSLVGTSKFSYVIGRVGNPDTGDLASMMLVASLVLFVPVVLGLMHMLREREVEFGHVGGAVALLGLLVLPWAFMAGMLILAIGLYRAHAVQGWMAACVALAAVTLGFGAGMESEFLAFAGAAVMFLGLGSVGRMVMSESDEVWDTTPEIEGFRPVAGIR